MNPKSNVRRAEAGVLDQVPHPGEARHGGLHEVVAASLRAWRERVVVAAQRRGSASALSARSSTSALPAMLSISG